MSRFLTASRAAVSAAIFLLVCAAGAAAQGQDVIRGRVTGPDSLPIEAANVKATSYLGNVAKTTTTDRAGRFTLIFINGEGDYWIEVTKLGYTPKRFEVKKIGDEAVMLANVRLADASTKLDAVDVVAQRNRLRPNRNVSPPDVGGGDRAVSTNAVPPDQAGNLAAMAATVAGIQIIPGLDGATDTFSMLGLTSDQNNTTFDGLGSGVTALPPDILATTSIRPYPFDPSIGGFSGAQVAIQTIPGANFSRRMVSNVNIAPPLEWASPTALAQGGKFTNARVGGNGAGPIVLDRAFYNVAYNAGREFADLYTLLNTGDLGLTAAGVAPDSAARLVQILRGQRVPLDPAGVPNIEARDVAQFAANIDLTPSASGAGHALTIGGAGNYQRTQPVSRGGLLLTTPAHSGETTLWGANATLVHSNYFWFGVLTKTTVGFAASRNSTRPYEALPEGNVRVGSTLPDGSSSIKSLLFGGSSLHSSLTNQAIQLSNQLIWYTDDNEHTIKLTSGLMRDAFRSDAGTSQLGTFSYNSLADLEAGRPASFARTLGATTRSASQLTASASLGDYWRPSESVQIQYGLRADGNRFADVPAFNESILNRFDVRNDAVPNRIYLSPRIGLQWHYGSSPQVSYAPGAARPPRAVIHAGAGVFQNVGPAQRIDAAVGSTGLPGSAQSIACVGAASPVPDWDGFLSNPSSIPSSCADGSSGSVFATASPNATLFDRNYRQPRSLRAAADWSGPVLDNRFVLGVQSIISSGVHQQSVADINLNPATRFTLSSEADRPVFVEPTAIVPGTGGVSVAGSRVSPDFGRVLLERSDLRIVSKQISINVKPVTASARLHWDVTYTLQDARETFNGFTSTAGNPFDIQSGARLQAGRHTVSIGWFDFPIFDVVYISGALRLASGAPYTPMIAGDVNGDGAMNDRAFIADPARTKDTAAARAMQLLLSTASPAVRKCLETQLGTIAARGSCQSPWTAAAGLVVKFNPQKIGLPKRATVTLTLQNPLALADLAFHGGDGIHGWGQNIAPDQNLLFVRGFDAGSRQFKYDVNNRFGSTRPQQSSAYSLPFVSLGLNIDVGMPRERQLLTQRLDAGRRRTGAKATPDAMTAFGTNSIPNPMLLILQQSDSLRLTQAQADSLARLSRAFVQFADSVWTPAGRYLAGLPGEYNRSDAYDRYVRARERTVDFLLTLAPEAKHVLTSQQRRRLPLQVANFLDERVLRFLRSSSAGNGSSFVVR